MAKKSKVDAPSMSDAAVEAKTGKRWAQWFALLDAAGAAKLEHRAIVGVLSKNGVGPWWRQMVTVEYERSRGLRARHETAGGFSVSVSKTLAAPLSKVYSAAVHAPTRKRWFAKGRFEPSSQTKDKYLRGAWNDTARLEIGFTAKGPGKAQIALQVGKLASKAEVDRQRAAWKQALAGLEKILA